MTGSATLEDNDVETRIRNRFPAAGLVVESDPTRIEIAGVHQQLGRLVAEMPAGAHFALLTRYPALIIAALAGHAAGRTDRDGDFWEGFAAATGIRRDETLENAVEALLGDMIAECGLLDVPALRSRSVIPLLELHAGLPAHAVDGLVAVVEAHVAGGHEPSGTAVLDRLTEPGFAHRLAAVPSAFVTLLDHAPDIAVTLLSRITAALVASVAGPGTWNPQTLTPATVDLPPMILEALAARLRRTPFLDGVPDAESMCTTRFPELRYDAAEGSLNVVVPATSTPAAWRVWAGGAPEQLDVAADEAAAIPVTAALRECVLIKVDDGTRRSVPVLDPNDPIVLFAPDGRIMSRHRTLPAGEVVALVPKDARLVGADGEPVTIVDTRTGPWNGWLLRTLDLAGQSELTAARDGRPGRAHRVRPVESPSIELPEALPGVVTRDGDAVHGERPLVDLPAHEGDDVKEWRVRVRRVGDLDWIVDYPWEAADYVTSADPFDGIDAPLLGRYEIVVSDSYGLHLRRIAVLAEGLDVTHDPAVRLPSADGLAESTTELSSELGLALADAELDFGHTDTERTTRVGDGDGLDLVVRPPHAQVRVERPGQTTTWQTALPTIDIEAADHRRIAVHVPGAVDMSFALLDADLDIVREWDAAGRSGTEFSLPTRPVADAARRLVTATLVALIEDEAGDTEEAPVATIVRGDHETGGAPDTDADDLTAEWMGLDALQAAETEADAESPLDPGAAEADEKLVADPTASLIALGDSPVAPARITAMLIRSGLTEHPFAASAHAGVAHPNPYIGLTLATSAIVDPDAADRDEVQAYLETRGGSELLRLLATGRMSDPRTGVFDRNVMAVEAMPREQVDMLFEHFRLVPGPVLDLDMRTSATIEAFHRRAEWMADPVSLEAPRHVNKMLRDVRRASPELYDLIAARNEALDGVDTGSNPWMLLSMQSLTFAAVARLQAHGRLKQGGLTDEGRAMWAKLADYFPAMVSADLLIANAVAVRAAALARPSA